MTIMLKLDDSNFVDLDEVYNITLDDAAKTAIFRFKTRSELTFTGLDHARIRAALGIVVLDRDTVFPTDDGGSEVHGDGLPVAAVYYTNHRGETAWRRIIPCGIPRFGVSEFHKEPQWLVEVWDCDKKAGRTYAMDGISAWSKFDANVEDAAALEEKNEEEETDAAG